MKKISLKNLFDLSLNKIFKFVKILIINIEFMIKLNQVQFLKIINNQGPREY